MSDSTPREVRSSLSAVELVAQATRSDSRRFPRPTAVRSFYAAPFHLDPAVVDGAIARMSHDLAYQDIQMFKTDNGEVYLFSTDYLTPAWAKNLATGSGR